MRAFSMRTITLAAALLFFFASISFADDGPIEARLQEVLDHGVREYGARGVSAAVIYPDGKVWTGTSGISHGTVSIEPDMLFAIGSITKNMVAALTLQLVEEGVLSLDDPLSKWLPAYPHVDSTATLRQLLNHTSGIYMFWSNQKIWDDLTKDESKIWTPEEVLSYIKEPYFAPGEGYRYSNTNYLLLAMIIEKATGSKLSTEFRDRFWQPLGITNAYLSVQEEIPDNRAHVFGDNFRNDGSWQDTTFFPRASHDSIGFGCAGLFMAAEDLAKWCHALFEGEVVSEQSMSEMLQFVDHGSFAKKKGYGLGVQRFTRKMGSGELAIGHGGANIGTSADMVHLPEHNVSVVVMVNTSWRSGGITKDLIACVLRDLGVLGRLPYIDPFLIKWFLLCTIVIVIVNVVIRKRKKARASQSNEA
jgi:D-alanyl-D-alanine carboxypeptidase